MRRRCPEPADQGSQDYTDLAKMDTAAGTTLHRVRYGCGQQGGHRAGCTFSIVSAQTQRRAQRTEGHMGVGIGSMLALALALALVLDCTGSGSGS